MIDEHSTKSTTDHESALILFWFFKNYFHSKIIPFGFDSNVELYTIGHKWCKKPRFMGNNETNDISDDIYTNYILHFKANPLITE